MINLVSLKIENFMSIEDMYIEFPKPGNYIITGYNEIGGDSNGSGKSAILNSIIWCLFGKTARGLGATTVARIGGQGTVRVVLRCAEADQSHSYTIDRSADQVNFSIDGKAISGHKRDIQQSINDTFHTNYDLVLSSIMFTKGQADFLTDTSDVAKKRLFKSLLRLEKIDQMYLKAKEIYDIIGNQAQKLEYSINENTNRKDRLEKEIQSYKIKLDTWEGERQESINLTRKRLESERPIIDSYLERAYKEKQNQLANLEQRTLEYKDLLPAIEDELSTVYKDIGYYESSRDSLTKDIDGSKSIEGKVCPYCGGNITKKSMAAHLLEKEQEIIKINTNLHGLYITMHDLEKTISQMEACKQDYVRVLQEYQTLLLQLESQAQRVESFEKSKKLLEEKITTLEKTTNPFVQLCIDKEKELETLDATLQDERGKFSYLLKTIDIYGYIKWVLSREGVVSTIIEKTFNRLEALINHYMSSICTEHFLIKISPQRELKSGALREEIEIMISQNGKKIPYNALSGGQEQRVTIAALLALYKLSKELGMNRFNFLLLDEVLDLSLAEKGQQDIIRLLEGMETEIRNIFVISHKDNLSQEFPFQIAVRRELDSITRLEGIYQ